MYTSLMMIHSPLTCRTSGGGGGVREDRGVYPKEVEIRWDVVMVVIRHCTVDNGFSLN